MVRLAQSTGDGALLWPKGCEKIEDVPYDLALALSHASTILHWQKNLTSEEMPPQWMWPFGDELEEWFEAVEEKRKEPSDGGSSAAEDEGVPMMQNALARERFGR